MKLDNPYQVVVFDVAGKLVFKAHVTYEEACFSEQAFAAFGRMYPQAVRLLADRTETIFDHVYVDFMFMNAPVKLGKAAWTALFDRRCRSHLSQHIGESVSNWVFWYRKDDPRIALTYGSKGEPEWLIVLGRDDAPIRFLLKTGEAAGRARSLLESSW